MPGVGASFGGGTETTAFGSWDAAGGENNFPILLDLDTRPNAGLQNPPYTRMLAPDNKERVFSGGGPSPLEFGGAMYDLGEMRVMPTEETEEEETGEGHRPWEKHAAAEEEEEDEEEEPEEEE
jgi:hypothetical protein